MTTTTQRRGRVEAVTIFLTGRLAALRPGLTAAVLLAPIVVFGVMGVLQRIGHRNEWPLWNLDTEASLATYYSAALLWLAAAAFALVARAGWLGRSAFGFSAVLALAALDDGIALHERIERATGVDWQILYLPVLILGAVALWWTIREIRPSAGVWRWSIVGGAFWGLALVLEPIQWWGGAAVSFYDPLMISEELLEMAGSMAFVIAAAQAGAEQPEATQRVTHP